MKATVARCGASSRGRPAFRPSWMSPGLTSHQQLDAGIAARQHAGRKALRKSKRPFENYFRTQFRLSPRVRLPVTQSSGVMSSYNAVKMMTDPSRSWGAPWDRGEMGTRTRHKRHDVLELTPPQFGEDAIDRLLEQLIEVRFAWDREDGVLCTSLVPDSLYGTTAHCRPYITEVAPPVILTSSTALVSSSSGGSDALTDDGEVVMVAGTPLRIKRRTPRAQGKSGQPKRSQPHSSLGFSGVDTVPSLVLDVSHGPFVTAPNAPLMTLRWKGEHRRAASAQSVLHILRHVRRVPVVGLPPQSALLLLKALATVEVEEPALAVSLAIAIGENYHGYSDTECLEALRCLRRVALVRELPDLAPPDVHAATLSASGATALPALYTDASLTSTCLSHFVRNAAPFLNAKIWSRLPEQSRHLLQRGFFLDWFDLIRLAISANEPQRLPSQLPNTVTEAPYAAKYLFFYHTLGLNEETLRDMVAHLQCTSLAGPASSSSVPPPLPHDASLSATTTPSSPPRFVDAVKEDVDRPLILWLCSSLLVRIVAECLGDVVRHVGDSLHQHAALAAERAEEARWQEEHARDGSESCPAPVFVFPQPYPVLGSGAYQRIGRRRPKRVRVRLLPFEAFPRVMQCFSCPFASVTKQAEANEQRRQRRRQLQRFPHERKSLSVAAAASAGGEMQSAFAGVLAESPRMVKHVKRASAALTWSTTVLRACHTLVQNLPSATTPPLSVTAREPLVPKAADTPKNHDVKEWARETVAMEVRHALCHRYVQSCVQLHMDALFSCIPWGEVEEQWESMLAAPDGPDDASADAADALLNAPKHLNDAAATEGGEPRSNAQDSVFTPEILEAALAELQPAAEKAGDGSARVSARLSREELHARAMMEELHERLEEFQVAVADLLEAHECFFHTPADANLAASS